ncbi:MAG TPA: efflux transporter periplasmic adaptor subunit [Kiritimatiellia bacterium]|nr:efflux transporter periplasmic adaptor subunit [Kiritimatiellia bacterium]
MNKTITGIALVLLVAAAATWYFRHGRAEPESAQVAVFSAVRGPITISVTEPGTIQSRERVIVRSGVEGRATLLWLVEEGLQVRTGDLLAELDSSRLVEAQFDQQLRVEGAQAALVQARENLEIVRSENASAVETASLTLRFARRALEKFTEGEFPSQLQQAEAEIAIAREEMKRAADRLEWSNRLSTSGHITRIEFEADELAMKRKELDVRLAEGRLRLLTNFTRPQQDEKLSSDVKQAEAALERAQRRSAASLLRAETDLRARESEHEKQVSRLARLKAQVAACRITAPTNGLVIYATSVRRSGRGGGEPLAPGQEIVERQELIYLPATSEMMAEIKVAEASMSRIGTGLTARVTVDALPGQLFRGRMARIGVLPDAADAWLNPNLKLFNCEVFLDNGSDALRPGMSCRVELILREFADAVYVPLQAVMQIGGRPHVYVQGPRGVTEPRPVSIGLDNNRMIVIESGLAEGEPVLLNPPLPPSSLEAQTETNTHAHADAEH